MSAKVIPAAVAAVLVGAVAIGCGSQGAQPGHQAGTESGQPPSGSPITLVAAPVEVDGTPMVEVLTGDAKNGYTVTYKPLPANSSAGQLTSAVAQAQAGAVSAAVPATVSEESAKPNDPQWPNEKDYMSVAQVCCGPNDGWDHLGSQQVGLAIIDSGISSKTGTVVAGDDTWDNTEAVSELKPLFQDAWIADLVDGVATARHITAWDDLPDPTSDHGSKVSSTALGKTNNGIVSSGVADNGSLQAGSGQGPVYSMIWRKSSDGTSIQTAAINMVLQANAAAPAGQRLPYQLLNMSQGSETPSANQVPLLQALTDQGVIVFAAPGNDREKYASSRESSPSRQYGPNYLEWPASLANVVGVANYQATADKKSAAGKTRYSSSSSALVDITAPGSLIESALGSTSGTSISSPFAQAVTAIRMSTDPSRICTDRSAHPTAADRRECVRQTLVALYATAKPFTDDAQQPIAGGSGEVILPGSSLQRERIGAGMIKAGKFAAADSRTLDDSVVPKEAQDLSATMTAVEGKSDTYTLTVRWRPPANMAAGTGQGYRVYLNGSAADLMCAADYSPRPAGCPEQSDPKYGEWWQLKQIVRSPTPNTPGSDGFVEFKREVVNSGGGNVFVEVAAVSAAGNEGLAPALVCSPAANGGCNPLVSAG